MSMIVQSLRFLNLTNLKCLRFSKVLDPGLQGTGSAFRRKLWICHGSGVTLMFEKKINFFCFFFDRPKNIFGKKRKIFENSKKCNFFSIISDFFSSIWPLWRCMPLTGTPKSLKGMPGAYFPRIYIFFYVALNFNLDFPKISRKLSRVPTPDSQKRYYDIQAILRKAPKGAIMGCTIFILFQDPQIPYLRR